jgi:colanic acid/amylovoran biosynthesis glycosyltransferase
MSLIATYRHQLFKYSEPFIHAQAANIPRHRQLFVGRTCVGSAPADADVVVLKQSKAHRALQTITRSPNVFVDLLRDRGVGLLHAHFGVEGVYAEKIAARLDIPLVTTFHGFDATLSQRALLTSGKPSWINYALHRARLAQRGTLFIAVSEFIRDRVLRLGFPAARTIVHYIGVDIDKIPAPSARAPQPTILHVARLVEKKGTADLIAAFAQVVRTVPDAKLSIVGDGPLGPQLRAQALSLGLADAVAFLGPKPNAAVLELMASSWVFCLPSVTGKLGDAEGLAIVLLEAAASGLPVVATRHGGIPEAVLHENTGILHKEHDVEGLAASLTHLLRDERARHELGNNGRQRVLQHFNLRNQSAALATVYESLR